ncbi:hypothetical protein MAFF212519_02160 [Clavibacter michiganensis]
MDFVGPTDLETGQVTPSAPVFQVRSAGMLGVDEASDAATEHGPATSAVLGVGAAVGNGAGPVASSPSVTGANIASSVAIRTTTSTTASITAADIPAGLEFQARRMLLVGPSAGRDLSTMKFLLYLW